MVFNYIQTPIVEPTELFNRTLGSETDIVSKEMYSFIDELNNDNLSLRPEGTASVVRSCIQHSLTYDHSPKLFYSGPMFRHERPQKGDQDNSIKLELKQSDQNMVLLMLN